MLLRSTWKFVLICLSSSSGISGQAGSEDPKYIRPHDDAGFFLPFKNFPSIEKEGATEEFNYKKESPAIAHENIKYENPAEESHQSNVGIKVHYTPPETFRPPGEEYKAPEHVREEYRATAPKTEYRDPEPSKEEYKVSEEYNPSTEPYEKLKKLEFSSPRYPTNFKYQQVSKGDVEEISKEDKIINKRIENIDETLKTIDKMMKDIPSEERKAPEVEMQKIEADSEEKLVKEFRESQKLLSTFPTKPEDTRR